MKVRVPQSEMKGLDSNSNPHKEIKSTNKANYVGKCKR